MCKASAAAVAALILFAASGLAGPSYAPAGITVAQLLARNRHAGGAFGAGAYHLVTQSTSTGGDVWTAETFWSGEGYRTTVTLGTFSWSYGSDRGVRWHEDANHLVLPSTDISSEVDPFAAALQRAEDPAGSAQLLGITNDSPAAFVLALSPASGLTERRYYDQKTYLLSRVEMMDYDGHQRVWSYEDYRPVSGRMVAYQVEYARDGTVTRRTKLVTYERIDSRALNIVMPASKPLFDLGGRDEVQIPARFTDDGIIVPVTIGGRGLDFLLDSGSSELLIDPQVARELGMGSSGAEPASFAGDFTIANVRAADFTVGDLTANYVALSTAAFQEDLPGQRVVGLLGTDFIASGALKVDFEKKTLTLLRAAPVDLAAQGWTALPLRMDWSVPLLKATFGDEAGYFIADLGADYSMLYPHYFARFPNRIPRGAPDQEEMVTLGGKPFGIKHLTMKRMVLGDWIFGDVQVVVPSAQYAQDRDYDGLIGRDTLSSFDLVFDYANNRLWFRPIDFK